jgi:hypothetical protein
MCIICGYGKGLPPCGEKSKKKHKDSEIDAFKKVEASPDDLFDDETY